GRTGWSAASSGLLHEDERVPGARQGALHEQEVSLGVGSDDRDLLRRRPLIAHVAGHAHALVDAAGGRARADRARLAVMVGAVRLRAAVEVMALDVTREALALRDAAHVDEVARGEHVGDRELLAELVVVDAIDPELADRRRT